MSIFTRIPGAENPLLISLGILALLEFFASAAVLALFLGVILGSVAALNRGKLIDQIIQVLTTALVSMPSFVMATLLLLIFALRLGWLPSMGNQPGGLVLPVISCRSCSNLVRNGVFAMEWIWRWKPLLLLHMLIPAFLVPRWL